MSKSKKNSKSSRTQDNHNSAQNCENNMNYAVDQQSGSATDCQKNQPQNCSETDCR